MDALFDEEKEISTALGVVLRLFVRLTNRERTF